VDANTIRILVSRLARSRTASLAAAGCALMIAGAMPALAQGQNYDSISTSAQRRACTPDVYRLCAGEIPNVGKITACLRRKRASLSDACRSAMGE
jgi:hypothetical protein